MTADSIFGSTAVGLLVIVYSLTNDVDSDIHYRFAQVDQHRIDNIIMGLPRDYYQILVYVVKKDGLPFQKPAATPKSIGITGKMTHVNAISNFAMRP